MRISLKHIDRLIDDYKKNHKGMKPLYVVLSPDEIKQTREEIRAQENHPPDYIITEYRDLKLAEHPALLNDKAYVSNELPETGS